jgi:transcriptional regulator
MKATKLSMLKMALPTDMEMAIPERLATANMDKAKKTILIFKSITLQSYFPLYTK